MYLCREVGARDEVFGALLVRACEVNVDLAEAVLVGERAAGDVQDFRVRRRACTEDHTVPGIADHAVHLKTDKGPS